MFTCILSYRDDDDDAVVYVVVLGLWLVGFAPEGASHDSSSTSISPKQVTQRAGNQLSELLACVA